MAVEVLNQKLKDERARAIEKWDALTEKNRSREVEHETRNKDDKMRLEKRFMAEVHERKKVEEKRGAPCP